MSLLLNPHLSSSLISLPKCISSSSKLPKHPFLSTSSSPNFTFSIRSSSSSSSSNEPSKRKRVPKIPSFFEELTEKLEPNNIIEEVGEVVEKLDPNLRLNLNLKTKSNPSRPVPENPSFIEELAEKPKLIIEELAEKPSLIIEEVQEIVEKLDPNAKTKPVPENPSFIEELAEKPKLIIEEVEEIVEKLDPNGKTKPVPENPLVEKLEPNLKTESDPSIVDEWGEKSEPEPEPTSKFPGSDPPTDEDEWGSSGGNGSPGEVKPIVSVNKEKEEEYPLVEKLEPTLKTESDPPIVDEWGEKSEPDPEPTSKFPGSDPPKDEDEWGSSEVELGNGSPGEVKPNVSANKEKEEEESDDGRLWELKRALVDTVYGSNLGFLASTEVRAEALELVSQLEASNPTSAPTEAPQLLDGNWVLVYTAFSELLPLLAAGSIPTIKVEKIGQSIDSSDLIIDNSITLSSPFSTLTFSASASFEVRTPSRVQVEFKEGTFKPPVIKSKIDLPENINIFGQTINLSPVQQSLGPIQSFLEGISRTISGQPPLKIPIPGERTKSWLLITYLDKDFRISRGDGGLFVLVKEGSQLLNN